jgi:hypothetical protein
MDDANWGNTRVVVGEGKDKKVIADAEDHFDDSMIPLKRFSGKLNSNEYCIFLRLSACVVQNMSEKHGKRLDRCKQVYLKRNLMLKVTRPTIFDLECIVVALDHKHLLLLRLTRAIITEIPVPWVDQALNATFVL